MTNAVIAGYARSPFHFAGKGGLARVRPDDLAAQVVRALISRTGVNPEDIEDIIVGCAFPEGEQGLNVARLIGLLADLPLSVAGVTVNRFCGSSMQSIHIAAGQIALGAGDVFVCAGIESMSRVPMMGLQSTDQSGADAVDAGGVYRHGRNRGERGAEMADPSRRAGGVCGTQPSSVAAEAAAGGRFADEIVAITGKGGSDRARRLHSPGHDRGSARRAEAGFRQGWHGDGGHLVAVDRWGGRGAGVQRDLRREARAAAARADQVHRRGRLCAGDHGHRPGRRDEEGTGAGWTRDR